MKTENFMRKEFSLFQKVIKTSQYDFIFEMCGDHTVLIEVIEKGKSKCCWIPDNVFGLPVTEIDSECFVDCQFKKIALPNNLKIIHSRAFVNCKNLGELEFPLNFEQLQQKAFVNCTKLFSVKFCNHIKLVADQAFYDCNLTSIEVPRLKQNQRTTIFKDLNILKMVEKRKNKKK